jgi:hypothetical protein
MLDRLAVYLGEGNEFLLERLEAGPVNSDDLVKEAKQEGIAEKTLRRAKKELGIKSRKQRGSTDGGATSTLACLMRFAAKYPG